jgi:hypothetical protein
MEELTKSEGLKSLLEVVLRSNTASVSISMDMAASLTARAT